MKLYVWTQANGNVPARDVDVSHAYFLAILAPAGWMSSQQLTVLLSGARVCLLDNVLILKPQILVYDALAIKI
jgi:hypothetical protein